MKRICKICGQAEDEHHEPEWLEPPDGCVCDPLTWDVSPLPPICEKYKGDGEQNCERCEHEKGCHAD